VITINTFKNGAKLVNYALFYKFIGLKIKLKRPNTLKSKKLSLNSEKSE
jgi:hypothetical protein